MPPRKISSRLLSFLELAEHHHNVSISHKTGELSEIDSMIVFLNLFYHHSHTTL